QTMRVAQTLYERGLITYMRTDSTNLSKLALSTAKQFICDNFGPEYSKPRQFKTHSKGAQEAHEAIRPTFIANTSIEGSAQEQKLYNLIWKRTVASQMAEAKLLNTNISIAIDKRNEHYLMQSAEIVFDGFLKLYMESSDDDVQDEDLSILPPMNIGNTLIAQSIDANCRFTQAPYRYSEPSLVKKLEELGIGRPSTYAPTISTLTTGRGYLIKGDKAGESRTVVNLNLKGDKISRSEKVEQIGAEKGKLLPTEIGMTVSDFLVGNFSDVLDYGFTAEVENDFDKIAEGELDWHKCISNFYPAFHKEVEAAVNKKEYYRIEREIGVDPADGKKIIAKLGQFGPYVQKGEDDEKIFASLGEGQLIESITLEEALKLFSLPRVVGDYEGSQIVLKKGKFGAYMQYDSRNISLPKGSDPLKLSLQDCIDLIVKTPEKKAIASWGDISIMNGPYGPYIKAGGKNYRLPKSVDPLTLSEEQCKEIIKKSKK
ncbi:MAG: DNA topoisomerase, partial [Candidatus Cryptobacteroides sp.]